MRHLFISASSLTYQNRRQSVMVCAIDIIEKPQLNDPILIEGLPGIGFVANIAALHLIKKLNAKKFVQIFSSSFQDFAITTEDGGARTPINELYYAKREDGGRDIIIWYGNTQALTTVGQYELVGKVLDIALDLGCRFVVSIGGFKKDEVQPVPAIYSTATDLETMQDALDLGTKVMVGHVFGIAGLSIGLARIRDLKGFSLLSRHARHGSGYQCSSARASYLKQIPKIRSRSVEFRSKWRRNQKNARVIWNYSKHYRRKEERGTAITLVYLGFSFAHELIIDFLDAVSSWSRAFHDAFFC